MGAAALALEVPVPRRAPAAVDGVGEGATQDLEKLAPIIDELRRLYLRRAKTLTDALGDGRLEDFGVEPGLVPELDLVVAWYRSRAAALRRSDPELGRLADELLALRCLVRDAEDTARHLAPEGVLTAALGLAWIFAGDELAAAITYTTRPDLSFDEARRVPYVYNLWSGVRGLGRSLLGFVAWRTGQSTIALHPLHEGVAEHYIDSYGPGRCASPAPVNEVG